MSIMSKLTEKRVKIKINETTKLSQILFWLVFAICIITPFLHHFLQTSNYINIGQLVCCTAYILSIWNNKILKGSSMLDFKSTKDAINSSIKNQITN